MGCNEICILYPSLLWDMWCEMGYELSCERNNKLISNLISNSSYTCIISKTM